MKKYVSLVLVLTSVAFLTGCQGKSAEDAMSIDTDKALEEIAALTNGEITPAPAGQTMTTSALPATGAAPLGRTPQRRRLVHSRTFERRPATHSRCRQWAI